MQERLFPQAPARRAVQPQRLDIPPRHRSAAGAWAIHMPFVARVNVLVERPDGCHVFLNATSMYTLLLVQRTLHLVVLLHLSIRNLEEGGVR
jgi:hypothetical protein